jgi:hypothetical protein
MRLAYRSCMPVTESERFSDRSDLYRLSKVRTTVLAGTQHIARTYQWIERGPHPTLPSCEKSGARRRIFTIATTMEQVVS